MARNATAEFSEAHPAPHRDRVGLWLIMFVTLAPPLAWSVHLVVNYGFASYACYPGAEPLNAPIIHGLWAILIAVDLVSMAIGAAAIAVAYRAWRASAAERAETRAPLMEIGEGRTRFLAIWGMLIGSGFLVAVMFDFVGLWVLPICG